MALDRLVSQVLTIARNVTGRVDSNDPLFTDTIMLGYLNDFIQTEHPYEVRINNNRSWWEWNLTTSQDVYNVNPDQLLDNGFYFSTIEPPAYVDGFEIFWYQDPTEFYRIWPQTQTYQESRPTYVLYYNNQLLFRNPPDQDYSVKISTYNVNLEFNDIGQSIPQANLLRYLAYGMALDIFSDYGEKDKWNEVFPQYQRYKGQVLARTHQQNMNQRTIPRF